MAASRRACTLTPVATLGQTASHRHHTRRREESDGALQGFCANQVLASASPIFTWAIREGIGGVKENPCRLVQRNPAYKRARVLSDSELATFWTAFADASSPQASTALKIILLTGQRPGEVAHMRREHIEDGWWTLPGKPDPALGWPGTKNDRDHNVWLSAPVRDLIADLDGDGPGFVLANARGHAIDQLDREMRDICATLGVANKVTPHDLRRTFSTTVTGLGFGRDAMNRVTNHIEGGIADTYDRYTYRPENKKIMETVARHIIDIATGTATDKVVPMRGRNTRGNHAARWKRPLRTRAARVVRAMEPRS